MKKKIFKNLFGFTLAEILITIGIIGLVSAMTIPNLISKVEEQQTIAKVRQANSILAQAVKLAYNEYGEPDEWGFSGEMTMEDAKLAYSIMKQFLKISRDCGTTDSKGECIYNENYKFLDGRIDKDLYAKRIAEYKFQLINGFGVSLAPRPFEYDSRTRSKTILLFRVDINGSAPPNIYGKDMFNFDWSTSNKLSTTSISNTIRCNIKDKSTNYNGHDCASWIIRKGNMNYLRE